MLMNYRYIPDILHCIENLLAYMTRRHCKVFLVRFDLRFPAGTFHQGRNDEISQFMKALTNHFTDHGIETCYIWAREQWSSDAPHYHVALLLDGSQVQHPMRVWLKAEEIWSRITNGPHALVHRCSDHVMICRPSGTAFGDELLAQQQAFRTAYEVARGWMSYLAKEFSKEDSPFRIRRYGATQVMTPQL